MGGGLLNSLRRRYLWCLCCVGLCVAWSWPVVAEPQVPPGWRRVSRQQVKVQVQSTSHLSLRVKRNRNGRPVVEAVLVDDRKKGIPEKRLFVHFPNGERRILHTNRKGVARSVADGWPKRGVYRLSFAGEGRHAQASVQRRLDLDRVDLQIKTEFPPPLASGSKRFVIVVMLSYQGRPLRQFPLSLLLSTPDNTRDVKTPGRHQVSETLWPLMTLRSDRRGELRFVWEGKELTGPASLSLVLQFDGNRYFLPQRVPILLTVLAPGHDPTRQWLWSVGLGLLALLVLGWAGWRLQKLWKDRMPRGPVHHQPKPPPPPELAASVTFGKEGTSLEAFDVTGWLRDAGEKTPIAHAHIVVEGGLLQTGEEPEEWPKTRSDEWGRFRLQLDGLQEAEIRVYHSFYRAKTFKVKLPHRGAAHRIQIKLVSYKQLIFHLFARAVWHFSSGSSMDPTKQTAREVLAAMPAPHSEQLTPLAMLFEEAYYGAHMPEVERYTEAAEEFERTIGEV